MSLVNDIQSQQCYPLSEITRSELQDILVKCINWQRDFENNLPVYKQDLKILLMILEGNMRGINCAGIREPIAPPVLGCQLNEFIGTIERNYSSKFKISSNQGSITAKIHNFSNKNSRPMIALVDLLILWMNLWLSAKENLEITNYCNQSIPSEVKPQLVAIIYEQIHKTETHQENIILYLDILDNRPQFYGDQKLSYESRIIAGQRVENIIKNLSHYTTATYIPAQQLEKKQAMLYKSWQELDVYQFDITQHWSYTSIKIGIY